ncbi:septum formation inhibitor Maf [Psychroserpens mesophilus]|uniref:septum formation inhibitor Maf n=1 Tax=Psychroserpens mesophilus TaxID=325473 RepID=UPI003D65170A
MHKLKPIITVLAFGIIMSCKDQKPQQAMQLDTTLETEKTNINTKDTFSPSEAFKSYWYSGKAEITSYKLEQARYGELRDGTAVLIYVTEDFLPEEQVKADTYSEKNISVLKLNATKNFNTGMYPYSIMQSTFYPLDHTKHALKVTCSVQEWCGQVYTQLNNRNQFEITSHSYFESEGDQDFKIDQTILENELWSQLRIDPTSLPTGNIEIIPSFEFIRLKHIELKAYEAKAELTKGSYQITYPQLNRTLIINFNPNFPFNISSWEDTYKDGYGENAKILTTKATRLETINSAYWSKNSNADEDLRESLKLN